MDSYEYYRASLYESCGCTVEHFGIKKKSGRYPYGSGDRPYQHDLRGHKKAISKMSPHELEKDKEDALRKAGPDDRRFLNYMKKGLYTYDQQQKAENNAKDKIAEIMKTNADKDSIEVGEKLMNQIHGILLMNKKDAEKSASKKDQRFLDYVAKDSMNIKELNQIFKKLKINDLGFQSKEEREKGKEVFDKFVSALNVRLNDLEEGYSPPISKLINKVEKWNNTSPFRKNLNAFVEIVLLTQLFSTDQPYQFNLR